jgi:hypothetical protein
MTGIIQITTIGTDADNFLLFSDVDNYLSAFESNVSRQALIDGFPSANIPDGTTIVKALSTTELCNVELDIPVTIEFLLLQTGDPIEQQNTNYIKTQ